MILKKSAVTLLAAFAIFTIPVSNVFAQGGTKVCFNAEITRVGKTIASAPNSGNRIEVKGGSCGFADFFPLFLETGVGSSGLAIVLTAFALNKTVTLRVPDPVVTNSLVFAVHLDK